MEIILDYLTLSEVGTRALTKREERGSDSGKEM